MRTLSVEVFEREWRHSHDSIFLGLPATERPFRNETWGALLLPYAFRVEEDVFSAIAEAAQIRGDEEFVIWNAEVIDPEPGVIVPWDREVLNRVRYSTPLGQFETHLFGRSAAWGWVCTIDDFSWLAGDSSFMDTVTRRLGGCDAIRRGFLQFAETDWDIPADLRERLLDLVGWRDPRPPA